MQTLENVRAEVAKRGVAPVARELGVNRQTLTTVLLGTARPGSVALVEQRLARRPRPKAA
jgi:DNA-binding phage protein